jgi:DNA helicase-2/ATP-dependent DNA helicase PcrA
VEQVKLSYTALSTYEQCPLQYRFRYVDRLDWKPRPALSFGQSLHAALESLYSQQTPHFPDLSALLAMLDEVWVSEGYADAEEEERYREHAREVLTEFYRTNSASFRLPASLEQPFQLDLGDILLSGKIDRLDRHPDGTYEIIDYKTNRKIPPLSRLANDLQLPIYQLAATTLWGIRPGKLTFYYLLPNQRFSTRPWDEEKLQVLHRRLRAAADGIRNGSFQPNPNPLCPWCDFIGLCPAAPSAEDGLSGLVARYGDLLRRKRDLDDAIRELESRITDAWPEGEHTVHSRRFALSRLEEDGAVSFRLVEDGPHDEGSDASA